MPEDVQRDLGRLEGKVDGVHDAIVALSTRLDRRDAAVDTEIANLRKSATSAHVRISGVERRLAFYTGVAACVMWGINHIPNILNTAIATIR